MEVSRNEVISNANHGSFLPPSWRTLYELSRLPDAALEKAITDGVVNPDMQRREGFNGMSLLPLPTPAPYAAARRGTPPALSWAGLGVRTLSGSARNLRASC